MRKKLTPEELSAVRRAQAQRIKEERGSDFYSRAGAKGSEVRKQLHEHGLKYTFENPEIASKAGKIGGKKAQKKQDLTTTEL